MQLDVVVESVVVVKVDATLVDKLRICEWVKLRTILVRSHVVVVDAVVTQENIVVDKSSDESVAVDHVRSMAENRGKVKR